MKVIEPLFLNDLRETFTKVREGRYERDQLGKLRDRISKLKIFDPACGSGNFLIIAYKELRKLEMEIIQRMDNMGADAGARLFDKGAGAVSTVSLNQFYGIEIDDFAHEIAILALWLAEHQMNAEFERVFGRSKPTLPLADAGHIVHGNACRVDWEEVCPKVEGEETYILGNPPYLGFSVQNAEQKKDMKTIVGKSTKLDYIAAWFIKAAIYGDGSATFAFVSTNSICQGEQVDLLWPRMLDLGLEIFFCVKNFKWDNNAKYNAAVICSIIGVAKQKTRNKRIFLNNQIVECNAITPYLTSGQFDLTIGKRSKSISGFESLVLGNMAKDGGALFLDRHSREELLLSEPKASIYIRKVTGSYEFINDKEQWCLWVGDQGFNSAQAIPLIKKRFERVSVMRSESVKEATRKYANLPYRFVEVRHQETDSIIVPRVSSERRDYVPIGYLASDVIVKDSAYAIYNAGQFLFSVIISKMHMLWLETTGGKLKNDYRYSSQLVYNTFPFPPITLSQEQTLTETALSILAAREQHPGSTLADLYDPDKMPDNLREAHRTNDLAVEACYRAEPFTSDEERLAYLFKLYEEMIAAEKEKDTLFAIQKKAKKTRKTKK
jgi:hypothetical protein